MMLNADRFTLYKQWAPDGARWTAWAKPVLFASLQCQKADKLDIPETPVLPNARTMVVVDLPGRHGVEEALALAKKGFRPVPLYNGVMGMGKTLVSVRELGEALYKGADILQELRLPDDAPPVFMLDSDRMSGKKVRDAYNTYDNRWCVFPQDMPSAACLKSRGIERIIVRIKKNIEPDLERILYDYQKNGIALYALRHNANSPKELTVPKRSPLSGWAYRFRVTVGLRRSAAGGFGGKIPDPYDSGGSGAGYYRFG